MFRDKQLVLHSNITNVSKITVKYLNCFPSLYIIDYCCIHQDQCQGLAKLIVTAGAQNTRLLLTMSLCQDEAQRNLAMATVNLVLVSGLL